MAEQEQEQEHPEIPQGPYCKDSKGICPHWKKTEKGARCELLQEEHTRLCYHHLVWDQVKMCNINREKRNRDAFVMSADCEVAKETCPCGKEVELWRRRGSRGPKPSQEEEPS